jgi:hypothetical protein
MVLSPIYMGESSLSLIEQIEDLFDLYGREFAQSDRGLAKSICMGERFR